MTLSQHLRERIRCSLAVLLAATLAACSGGGGGGTGSSTEARLLRIEATAVGPLGPEPITLLDATSDGASALPLTQTSPILFTFAGPIDAGSVPAGPFDGLDIERFTTTGLERVNGTLTVEDDPTLPAGNRRRIRFQPSLAVNSAGAFLAFQSGQNYVISVRNIANGILIDGQPLNTASVASFSVCDPSNLPTGAGAPPAGPAFTCLGDIRPGAVFVVGTVPETSDPALASVEPTIPRISAFFSEPLLPSTIGSDALRVLNLTNGLPVPGTIEVWAAGTPEAGPDGTRIDFVFTGVLPINSNYELLVDQTLRDFGGFQPLTYDPAASGIPASGKRRFATSAGVFCAAAPIVEDFTTTTNRSSVSGLVTWDGSGSAFSSYPIDILGDGSFGSMVFPAAGSYTLDTGLPASTGFVDGRYATTTFVLVVGATLRIFGPHPAHIQCSGTVLVAGSIIASAGSDSTPGAVGTPEQGPQVGQFNNPVAAPVVLGGIGGPGAGAGGRASQEGSARTPRGESGFGPNIAGLPNAGPAGVQPSYGGGEGGIGGFRFPAGGVQGELGGLGGAGGTGYALGGSGLPQSNPQQGCSPFLPTAQTPAAPSPIPASMLLPITNLSAGSGGGGGGDRFETLGALADDQGGGGGGGGGGVRISCRGSLAVSGIASITCNGAPGALGSVFFSGSGAGGSGGQIWLQSLTTAIISPTAVLAVAGGESAASCTSQASGAGGAGLIQIEDQDGIVDLNFLSPGSPQNRENVTTLQAPLVGNVAGTVMSQTIDTGGAATVFDPQTISAVTDLGSNPAPGSAVEVEFQGFPESLSGGTPNLGEPSAWVTPANIADLNGLRYIRWRITFRYNSPALPANGATPTHTFPRILSLSFGYSTPC